METSCVPEQNHYTAISLNVVATSHWYQAAGFRIFSLNKWRRDTSI